MESARPELGLLLLLRVHQGAGVRADVVVFVLGLVHVQQPTVDPHVHAARVEGRHRSGHQRDICTNKQHRGRMNLPHIHSESHFNIIRLKLF